VVAPIASANASGVQVGGGHRGSAEELGQRPETDENRWRVELRGLERDEPEAPAEVGYTTTSACRGRVDIEGGMLGS
jgi:hypothetical protein